MALSNQSKYDVFLSFRGEDTRSNFISHLYDALSRNGITTFKDDDEVRSNASSKEIEESRFSIVILSKSYASSSWCLDKLVKMMDLSKKKGHPVLPVYYYDFNQSNLRRQGPVFGELFARSEMEKVRAWTSVLVEASNLNGIGLIDHRYQATYINEIVETVLNNLKINKFDVYQNAMRKKHDILGDRSSSHEQLVGIDHRLQKVKELLQVKHGYKSAWATYDVYMCFKDNDTCKDFADKLHRALEQRNIYAVRSDETLARVKSIDSQPMPMEVNEESNIAVVVFSKSFAASAWCLDEVEKIMKCNERFGQVVYPIFFDVDTYDVRYQKGPFGEAFMRNKPEKLEIWRKALVKVCSFAGWHLNCTPKSDEAIVIENIVKIISRKLNRLSLSVGDILIGIKAQMKHVISLLKLKSNSVEAVGIWGMGGIGKTTLARAVFDQLSAYFESSCFVENIREVSKCRGIKHIQREMLSTLLNDENLPVSTYDGVDPIRQRLANRKVLLVLDDVFDISQLEALIGSRKWFGDGSRIIITTRDESLLVAHNIMRIYHVKPLDDSESYQFLRRHAFKKDESTKAYKDLFPPVVSYAAGLPLALKVLGSLLCGKNKKEWTSTLARLEVFPEKVIQDRLKISYDSLNAAEKEIFLHIACFFNNTNKDYTINILDSCGFFGDTGIKILEQKSLLHILKGHIKMHKLIQQMGRDIVRQMHPDEPGKRSRLWHAEDVYDTLMDSKSVKEVDAIVVDDMHDYDYDDVDLAKALKSMNKLRLLQIRSHNKFRFLERSDYLPEKLRWLTWENYPLPSLPQNFVGDQLVGLELRGGSLSEAWHGIKFLWRLCFLDLSYSRELIKTPDFTGTPNLEELKLEYCIRLIKVHGSIGCLDKLRVLSFRSCRKLNTIPISILKLKSLRVLNLNGCENLKRHMLMNYRLPFPSENRMMAGPASFKFLSNVEIDLSNFRNLGMLSLTNLTFGLKLPRPPLKIVVDKRLFEAKVSECKISQELVVDKKNYIPLLPGKGI